MASAIAEQTTNEHGKLLDIINDLLAAVRRFPQDIEWGSAVWAQDQQFLDFVKVQRISLIAARDNAVQGFYREAYNTIRMVLEGYLLLRLISTCDKYPTWYKIQRAKGDKSLDDAKAKFKQELTQRVVPDLIRVEDEGGNILVLIRRGRRVVDAQGRDTGVIVPYYYGAWRQYWPKEHRLKKPEMQKELLPEWAAFKSRRAKPTDVRHRDLYQKLFTFDSLIRNLCWNGVLNRRTAARVIVHYNFLSGFTHSTRHAISLSKPWSRFGTANDTAYNHYKSELALLYVCHLLAMHLELALYYFQRWRPLHVKNVQKLYRRLCRTVNQEFGYFWFIFNNPHEFDKFEQANRKSHPQKGIIYHPQDMKCGYVRYYDDPLERLRGLHLTTRELSTGNVFVSPFPRADALDSP
jgi:hypothetical protein